MFIKILFAAISLFLTLLAPFSISYASGSTAEKANKAGSAETKLAMSNQELKELLLFFDEDELFITATKHPQPLQEVPAIATIITADEIRNMGARNILDVLRTVPGFGVTRGFFGLYEIEVRGIKTTYSEKVKFLIDGHSVNDNIYGYPTWTFDDLIVDNVKRIEIIRGPGSALYGSNAFSAVINVVTKSGKDIDGTILSARGGSFNTGKFNLQTGKSIGDLDVAVFFDYLYTDGAKLHVDRDVIGNSGDTYDFEEKIDAGLKLAYKDWGFNSRIVSKRAGPYIGATNALNDESDLRVSQYFGELSYKHDVAEKSRILIKAYIDGNDINNYWELYPEGTTFTSGPLAYYGSFPDGMNANPKARERILGTELQADIQLTENNLLTVGAVGERREQFDVKEFTNFNPNGDSRYPPLFPMQEVTSWANFTREENRDIWAAYVQDVWNVTKDVSFTMGVRHDHYSDFGDTTNPRAALVWKFWDGLDAKLLYGKAFRAPSFAELYFINNPSTIGNPNLKPETMETYEASLGYTSKQDFMARATYFNNQFRDKIRFVPQSLIAQVAQNTGGANIQGLEFELKKEYRHDAYAYLNYTYQWPKDDDTGQRLADVPTHKGNVGGNVGFTKYLNANLNLFISGERPRADGDARNAVPAYAIVDLTLIAKNFYKGLELRGSAHNLLDQRYVDPAPSTIPGDFPRDGVSLLLEALYKF